MHVYIVTVA